MATCDKETGLFKKCGRKARYKITQKNKYNNREIIEHRCEEHKNDHLGVFYGEYWDIKTEKTNNNEN